MFRAGMPEAAVHEHRHPRLPKYKIGLAEDLLIPPPARDAVLPHQQSQRFFDGLALCNFGRFWQSFGHVEGTGSHMDSRTLPDRAQSLLQTAFWKAPQGQSHHRGDGGKNGPDTQQFVHETLQLRRA